VTAVFDWTDFKEFDVKPETMAAYVNRLLEERTSPVVLDRHCHDVIRADAGWTNEYLIDFPWEARMTRPEVRKNYPWPIEEPKEEKSEK
jgi:hypothetical protein